MGEQRAAYDDFERRQHWYKLACEFGQKEDFLALIAAERREAVEAHEGQRCGAVGRWGPCVFTDGHHSVESWTPHADRLGRTWNDQPPEDVDSERVLRVLQAPLARRWFVADLETATGLHAGKLYPVLAKLERDGRVVSGWEDAGSPRRRWYGAQP